MSKADRKQKPLSLKWFAAACVLLVLATFWVTESNRLRVSLAADLRLLILVLQTGLLAAGIIGRRGATTWRQRRWAGLLGGLALVLICIITFRWHWRMWYLTLAVLLRGYYVAGLLLAICFVLVCAISMMRGSLKWHRTAPIVVRLGLAGLFVFGSLETAAFVLRPAWAPEYTLPDLPRSTASGERTIAAIGGSTMAGLPYAPEFGLMPTVQWYLQRSLPELSIRVRNLAVTGINQSRAISLLRQLKNRPDVLVVYAGHNEFFHESSEMAAIRMSSFGRIDDWLGVFPSFQIINPVLSQYLMGQSSWVQQRTFIDTPVCPDSVAQIRVQRFQAELQQLFRWAENQQIAVVYCLPAADTATFEPNFSGCRQCDDVDRQRLHQQWRRVRALQEQQSWTEALTVCLSVLDLFPDVAEFHFRAGQCLRQLQQFGEADRHFTAAKDLDGFPIRTLSIYQKAALAAADEANVAVVRADSVLSEMSDDRLLSTEQFLDGIHPNLRACHRLGYAIADQILRRDGLNAKTAATPLSADFDACMDHFSLTSQRLASAYEKAAEIMDHYAEFRPFDQSRRQQRRDQLRQTARQLRSGVASPLANPIEQPNSSLP